MNFAADGRNIVQEASECLEVTHSNPNFILGNQFKEIMKREADTGNINDRRNHNRKSSSSKNAEIEAYLSIHYEFRYNTVLGRTEYHSKSNSDFVKVGMKSTRSVGSSVAMKAYQLPPKTSIPSSRVASLHASIPYRSISKGYHQ